MNNERFSAFWRFQSVVFVKRMILRWIHLAHLLRFFIVDSFVAFQPLKQTLRSLLIVRLDGIGDYILFRNFLETVKNHSRFAQYTITLCANESFKDFAETFDRDSVDDFIWIQPDKFQSQSLYRRQILLTIRNRGFEVVLHPTHSRDSLLGDSIVRCSGALESIGSVGDDVHSKNWERRLFNRWYTVLITASPMTTFEFIRNREFFEKFLNTRVTIEKPSLRINTPKSARKRYAVLCPDALLAKKRWHFRNFLEVTDFLYTEYQLESILVGGALDLSARSRREAERRSHVVDRLGKTTLTETTQLIRDAVLVISNDTSVSHIGVALDKPVIVISNGEHYGRFTYPIEVYPRIHYVFPREIANSSEGYDMLALRYRYGSYLDINSIGVSSVTKLARQVLNLPEVKSSSQE